MNLARLDEEFSDEDIAEQKNLMLESCRKFAGTVGLEMCCFRDMIGYERENEIAFLYPENRVTGGAFGG